MESITNDLDKSVNQSTNQVAKFSELNKALETAEKFEALLIQSMLKSMRATIEEDSLTGSDQQSMYKDLMDAELAKSISKSGGIGLQSIIKQQMISSPDISSNLTLPYNDNNMDLILRSKSMMKISD